MSFKIIFILILFVLVFWSVSAQETTYVARQQNSMYEITCEYNGTYNGMFTVWQTEYLRDCCFV